MLPVCMGLFKESIIPLVSPLFILFICEILDCPRGHTCLAIVWREEGGKTTPLRDMAKPPLPPRRSYLRNVHFLSFSLPCDTHIQHARLGKKRSDERRAYVRDPAEKVLITRSRIRCIWSARLSPGIPFRHRSSSGTTHPSTGMFWPVT